MNSKSIFIALVGKPNVGKSSLMNLVLGEKIAIVTQKPQTTRTSITGILTKGVTQFVFMDTPGIHTPKTKLGERMVKTSTKAIADVDLAVMLFEPYNEFNEAELALIENIKKARIPAIAVLNKKDTIKKEEDALQQCEKIRELGVFDDVMVISARENSGVDELMEKIDSYAMEGPHYFDDDAVTNMPEKVIVAEIVREKLLLNMRDEIPHGTNVEVESFKERTDKNLTITTLEKYARALDTDILYLLGADDNTKSQNSTSQPKDETRQTHEKEKQFRDLAVSLFVNQFLDSLTNIIHLCDRLETGELSADTLIKMLELVDKLEKEKGQEYAKMFFV